MIHIEQGVSNTIILTLKERLTFTAVSFQLSLTRNNAVEKVINLGSDTSSFPDRYNKFVINSTNSSFGITEKGNYEYTYIVTAYDSGNNSEVVEQGICFVWVNENVNLYTQRQSNNEFKTRE